MDTSAAENVFSASGQRLREPWNLHVTHAELKLKETPSTWSVLSCPNQLTYGLQSNNGARRGGRTGAPVIHLNLHGAQISHRLWASIHIRLF